MEQCLRKDQNGVVFLGHKSPEGRGQPGGGKKNPTHGRKRTAGGEQFSPNRGGQRIEEGRKKGGS